MSKSKKPSGSKAKPTVATVPGAVGGPGTAKGVNYQVDYAVVKSLDLISHSLCAPFKNRAISMEPRAGSAAGPTQWDLGLDPADVLIEAKSNPTRSDILDWLTRLTAASSSPDGQFVLVHAKGGGILLPSLDRLIRTAHEAAGDAAKFQSLLAIEPIPESALLLEKAGAEPHLTLRRAKIECHPEQGVLDEIDTRAKFLAGERDARWLEDLLFHKFSRAMTHRVVIPVRDLIEEIKAQGITLNVPPKIDPADLPPASVSCIAILQACPEKVPTEVLAAAVRVPQNQLLLNLQSLAREDALTQHGDIWSIRPLPSISHDSLPDLLARALEALLDHVKAHLSDGAGRSQVRNVIALGLKCLETHPKIVQKVYRPLEKLLKRKGDKRLVLLVSRLAIDASKVTPRGNEEVESEAQALICGQSWVYQRIGRLAEAEVVAEKSLKLGMQVGYDRNTAYCKKCIGRLKRMLAERQPAGPERDRLLSESVASLKDAVDRFRAHPQFGPSSTEVGDSHSLLGRTHLVAGRIDEAKQCVAAAEKLLVDPNDKDYLDLQILMGDLAAAEGDHGRADDHYEAASKPGPNGDAELSEIRARAIYHRGQNRAASGQAGTAISDFEEASEIWRELGEHRSAADPAWEAIILDTTLPPELIAHLRNETPVIRVAAVEVYRERLASCGGTVPSTLANPAPETCAQFVDEARKWEVINVVDW